MTVLFTQGTDNLENRLYEHQIGKFEGYTSTRLPVVLIYQEAFHSRIEALQAEAKIKTWGRRKKEALAYGGWEGIISLRKSGKKD